MISFNDVHTENLEGILEDDNFKHRLFAVQVTLDTDGKKICRFEDSWQNAPYNEETALARDTVALRTGSGIVVVDIDTQLKEHIHPDILKLRDAHIKDGGMYVETLKGCHLYFSTDKVLPNKAGLYPLIDIRAEGGCAFISNMASNYEVFKPTELRQLPDWLASKIGDKKSGAEFVYDANNRKVHKEIRTTINDKMHEVLVSGNIKRLIGIMGKSIDTAFKQGATYTDFNGLMYSLASEPSYPNGLIYETAKRVAREVLGFDENSEKSKQMIRQSLNNMVYASNFIDGSWQGLSESEYIEKLKNNEFETSSFDEISEDTCSQIIAKNRLKRASELTKSLTVHEWMIKSIIPSEGLVEIIGASGSYKTFITLDMLFCISAGINYHGQKTQRGTVIYVAGEGINGAKMRLRGLELHYEIEDYDLYILPMPSNMFNSDEMKTLAAEIKEISSSVSMIIFDTLHRNSAGAKESSSDDWAVILNHFDTYLKPVCKVVGWVHHTGIGEAAAERGRGTSSRYGSLETQVLIAKTQSKRAVMTNTKQKDADAFERIVFEFEDIETGLINEDGETVTTLYPQRADPSDKDTGKKSKLKKEHYALVASLRLSIKGKGQPINEEIKHRENIADGRMILVSEWRDDALKVITSSGDADEKKQNDAKAKAFKRYKQTLIEEKQIAEYNNFVYIVGDCTFKYTSKCSNLEANPL